MIGIIRRIIQLGGKKNGIRVKLGFLFGFLEAVFSAFSIIAVFMALNEANRVQQFGVSFDTGVIVACSLILLVGVIGKTLSRYFLSTLFGRPFTYIDVISNEIYEFILGFVRKTTSPLKGRRFSNY